MDKTFFSKNKMTGKENYLNTLLHKPHQWIPIEGEDLLYCGFEFNSMEKGPFGGGRDGFGVLWAAPESGGGTAMPVPENFLLSSETITEWKDIIIIPDPEAYHWEEDARAQLDCVDRSITAVDYGDGNGPFERLAALMGFGEALMAIALEPDAVSDLLNAITDFKLKCMDLMAKYYQPDTYTLYDDCATQQCTFMSPAAYKELISPCHKRLAEHAKELGMIPIIHCCGKADQIAGYFVEEGFAAWSSVQPCNDITGFLEKYGDRFCIAGGYNTNGLPGLTDDPEVLQREIERCFSEYGKLPGYIFAGFVLLAAQNAEDVWAATGRLCEQAIHYSHSIS